jgi:hypothetical protein
MRAASALVQKPASVCWPSSALSRCVLAGRSKKVSELEDALLERGQALEKIGHAWHLTTRRKGRT